MPKPQGPLKFQVFSIHWRALPLCSSKGEHNCLIIAFLTVTPTNAQMEIHASYYRTLFVDFLRPFFQHCEEAPLPGQSAYNWSESMSLYTCIWGLIVRWLRAFNWSAGLDSAHIKSLMKSQLQWVTAGSYSIEDTQCYAMLSEFHQRSLKLFWKPLFACILWQIPTHHTCSSSAISHEENPLWKLKPSWLIQFLCGWWWVCNLPVIEGSPGICRQLTPHLYL